METSTILNAVIQPLLGVICYQQFILSGFWRNVLVFAPISGFVMFLSVAGIAHPLAGLAAAFGMAIAFAAMLLGARWLDGRFGSGPAE